MAPIWGACLVAPVGRVATPIGGAVRSTTAGAVTLDGPVTLIRAGTVTGFGAGAVTITGMGALSVAARGMARILRGAAHSGPYCRPDEDRKKKLAPHCSYQTSEDQCRRMTRWRSGVDWCSAGQRLAAVYNLLLSATPHVSKATRKFHFSTSAPTESVGILPH